MRNYLKFGFLLLACLFWDQAAAQSRLLPLNDFYKDKFAEVSGKRSVETFFPASEKQLDLHHLIRDSSVQYYEFPEWFFKKHWINISRPEGSISISPLFNFSYGRELNDSISPNLFQNTRGLYVEGQLFDKVGFNFIFAENQARFMNYESDYFNTRGELYIIADTYSIQNAVIPGGGRTKPFKETAYDYAYSIGSISWQVHPNLRIDAGNNQYFIGSGYRSLLLSDNTFGAPGFRVHWQISPKWTYQVVIRNHKNLYRKPATNQVEQPYESKFFGATYLTYQPLENLSLSLFTSGNHLRGDSLVKHGMSWQMLVPVPLMQNDVLFGNSALFNGITGLNVDFALENTRLYGQIAVDKFNQSYLLAGQIGARFFKILNVKDLSAQVEMNIVPENFYASVNPKLSYSHTNLPLAHPKGNNFAEAVVRLSYEYKRLFVTSKSVYYSSLKNSDSIPATAFSIFSVPSGAGLKMSTFIQEFEVGYRINRRYNAMISAGLKARWFNTGNDVTAQNMVFVGLKTGIFNQYLDF